MFGGEETRIICIALIVLISVLLLQGDLHVGKEPIVSGVAQGLANYLNVDPTIIRVAWGVLILVDWLAVVPYVIGHVALKPTLKN
jgi:phage shock protein PspC (stress-responsive transcriptional regulator)